MKLLTAAEVIDRLPISRATFYRHVRFDDGFPKPVMIGKRKVWRDHDITAWALPDEYRGKDRVNINERYWTQHKPAPVGAVQPFGVSHMTVADEVNEWLDANAIKVTAWAGWIKWPQNSHGVALDYYLIVPNEDDRMLIKMRWA